MSTSGTVIDFDITAGDTLWGHTCEHEFKESMHIAELGYSKSLGIVSGSIDMNEGKVTFSLKVLGATQFSTGFSEAGVHTFNEKVGDGFVKGTITIH